MKFLQLCGVGVAFLACVSHSGLALAQTGGGLRDVEKAYADVDYEKTRTLAVQAIEHGGNDRASTGQLYLLWATAAAALDRPDEARTAFSYALAANPELKLDRNLSPKIRAPYLEARGALAGADGRAPLEVTLRRRKQELELGLRDSLKVAAGVVLSMRGGESGDFARRRFDASPTRRVPIPGDAELYLAVRVIDRHDNALFELGTEEDPERLVQITSNRATAAAAAAAAQPSDKSPLPYYVTSGALAAMGIAAGGAATVMYLRREDAAREWNGQGCEHPGLTRMQQCGSVDERRQKAERFSIGFAAAGGALLVGSVVSLVLAPASRRADVALNADLDSVTLRLRTSL
ncbi:MAG TPA: hypothetical protein VHP33_30185 [Polyangiaceae bacterium]|nr:hypothetical protein [Polyangiaceae bacterium]